MDLMRILSRRVFVPLLDFKRGQPVGKVLRLLKRSQYLSADEIASNQLASLKAIIKYAADRVPFYRRRFEDLGLEPDEISAFEDIKRIPALTKDDIRSDLHELVSDDFEVERLHSKRTGGSTSVPVRLYVDNRALALKAAATRRHNQWAGYFLGNKVAAIWGDTDKPYSLKESLLNKLVSRTIYLDTLKLDDDYMMRFVGRLRAFGPGVLIGHAHSLYIFARFLQDHQISDLPIESIISTSEILYDYERKIIERVFGPIVFDRYGCEELSIIASECEAHSGLHINAEGLYVETIGGDDTTPGKLVITDLWNRGMPLIRYEVGDMATTMDGTCACGRGLPRLGRVYGRTSDFLRTPEGKWISGISILDTFTIHVPGIKQVQIVQDQIDEITFRIVRAADFGETSIAELNLRVPIFFGPTMKHKIEYVDQIPQTERGKYRFSICNVPPQREEV